MEQQWLADQSQGSHVQHDSGMSVGSSKEEDVGRIRELEDEVRQLAEKANTASQRFADYENDIRVLEAKLRQEQRKNSAPTFDALAPGQTAQTRPAISRFNSFMGTRKVSPNQSNGSITTEVSREKELEEQVVKEQTARIAAEKKVKEVSAEIEDLSATLFQQANEMVATERKENAALKEKVLVLEQNQQQQQQQQQQQTPQQTPQQNGIQDGDALLKENSRLKEKLKALEQRDSDRRKRLERLEAANRRIDRARALLQPG